MKYQIIVLTIAALVVASDCFAWGQVGHDTTCAIAEQHLSRRAKKKIKKIFKGKSLVYWANWLDNESHTPEHENWKPWHYKNIEADQTYDEVPPAKDGDIVTALKEQVGKLKSGTLSEDEEALALKMVIHFMGDLHQPFHLGRYADYGGNLVKLTVFDKERNLHALWDEEVVECAHRWTYTEWAEQIDRISKQERKAMEQGTFDDWARETYEICQGIYEDTPEGSEISYDYIAKYTPLVEQQLLKAGIRLARVLNEIF